MIVHCVHTTAKDSTVYTTAKDSTVYTTTTDSTVYTTTKDNTVYTTAKDINAFLKLTVPSYPLLTLFLYMHTQIKGGINQLRRIA